MDIKVFGKLCMNNLGMKNQIIIFILSAIVSLSFQFKSERPIHWAKKIEVTSLGNLYQVDSFLYRSEQPSKIGMKELEQLGIKTIINVRNIRNDHAEIRNTNMTSLQKRMNTWTISYDEVVAVLQLIKNAQKPVLVHCKHGADRTGAVVACYRIGFQNWTKEQAIDEFQHGGYGYHADAFPNILRLLNQVDEQKLKSIFE